MYLSTVQEQAGGGTPRRARLTAALPATGEGSRETYRQRVHAFYGQCNALLDGLERVRRMSLHLQDARQYGVVYYLQDREKLRAFTFGH
jgi:hypothetical protein